MDSLFAQAKACLEACQVRDKLEKTKSVVQSWRIGQLSLLENEPPEPIRQAGHPARPLLVAPKDLPRRGLGTARGRFALVHAVAHIEFNAINLAWDAVYRFRGLPRAYYADWIGVVADEARHFELLQARLVRLAGDYGDLPAHNGLWTSAMRTAHDPLVRMALVPRVLEARGLDVTPNMIKNLGTVGDYETARILRVIWEEEVRHVEIGSRWFRHLCEQRDLEPETTFFRLLEEYLENQVRGPFDHSARLRAGFTHGELRRLQRLPSQ